jgi:death-on-curing protein
VAENQPFVDGNKRTGLAAALVFLRISRYRVTDPAAESYGSMIAIADRRLDKAGLAEELRRLARPLSEDGLPR